MADKTVAKYRRELNLYAQTIRRGYANAGAAANRILTEIEGLEEQYKQNHNDKVYVEKAELISEKLKKLKKTSKKAIKKESEEHDSLEALVKKFAAVVLLTIATFSLVMSVVDNPTITGAAVFGITQGGSTTLILNLLAFVIVILLIYPSSQIMAPRKTKKKSRSRKRSK